MNDDDDDDEEIIISYPILQPLNRNPEARPKVNKELHKHPLRWSEERDNNGGQH